MCVRSIACAPPPISMGLERNHRNVVFATVGVDEAILLSGRVLVMNSQPSTIISEYPVPFQNLRSPIVPPDRPAVDAKRANPGKPRMRIEGPLNAP